MSNSHMDFDRLKEQADTIHKLIEDANRVLADPSPISNLQMNFEREISNQAPKPTVPAQKTINTGKVGASILARGWFGAKAVNIYRNIKAKSNARKALLDYYQQLSVLHSMIIAEQCKIQQELIANMEPLQENDTQRREWTQALQKRQAELSDLMNRFNDLK